MEQFENSEVNANNAYLKDIEDKYLLDNQSVYLITNDIKENENMADMKKFLSTEGLSALVDQIKAEDAKVKAYVDQHIENAGKTYDVAGAAATVQGKLDEEVTRAKAREDAIAAAAESAQTDVDNLAKLVGTLPEGTTAKDVVDYVNVKTAGIATSGALEELGNQVSGLQTAVKAIQDDYLVEADKTELATAIGNEKTRAEGIEAGLRTDVNAIKGDYLKNADKEALQGGIDAVSGKVTTLIGEDANKSVRTIANEELAKQLVAEGAKESLDTLAEIAAWIQNHPDDASAMNKAITDLETLVGTLPEGVTATTVVGYIQEAIAAEKSRAEGIEAGLAQRITDLETSVGDGGSVEDMISEAVGAEKTRAEAAEQAAQAQADKGVADAAAALKAAQEASAHADELNTAMAGRMSAVEGAKHAHANKAELDLIATGDKSKWDTAAGKAHEHSNKTVIDGITAEKVELWDTVGSKASQADFETLSGKVDANTAALNSFTAITAAEVNALFGTASA
jgi:hypothetical protein